MAARMHSNSQIQTSLNSTGQGAAHSLESAPLQLQHSAFMCLSRLKYTNIGKHLLHLSSVLTVFTIWGGNEEQGAQRKQGCKLGLTHSRGVSSGFWELKCFRNLNVEGPAVLVWRLVLCVQIFARTAPVSSVPGRSIQAELRQVTRQRISSPERAGQCTLVAAVPPGCPAAHNRVVSRKRELLHRLFLPLRAECTASKASVWTCRPMYRSGLPGGVVLERRMRCRRTERCVLG